MALQRSTTFGLALIIVGLLFAGVVTALVGDFSKEQQAVAPTTTLPFATSTTAGVTTTSAFAGLSTTSVGALGVTTTTARAAGTTAPLGATTTVAATPTSSPVLTTTTAASGLASGGTGQAGHPAGGTPNTGAETVVLSLGGSALLVLGRSLGRYTRRAPGSDRRP